MSFSFRCYATDELLDPVIIGRDEFIAPIASLLRVAVEAGDGATVSSKRDPLAVLRQPRERVKYRFGFRDRNLHPPILEEKRSVFEEKSKTCDFS